MGQAGQAGPKPWLHIADVAAAEAVARDFRRGGLTGTQSLVGSDVYPEKLRRYGVDFLGPSAIEREEMQRIIMDELVGGVINPSSVAYLEWIIARIKSKGCDAVVLGCTEIPLVIDDNNSPLPTLDSTRLLARAALKRAGDTVEIRDCEVESFD